MGKGSILDKHLLMTLRAWELQSQRQKRERGLFMRQERAADRAASKLIDGIKSKQMCKKEKG